MKIAQKLSLLVILAGIVLAIVQFAVARRRPAVTAPAATVSGKSLRDVMRSDVHESYTQMSFLIWHSKPLTDDKMEQIGKSAASINAAAQSLQLFETNYKQQGWSSADAKLFADKRLQLLRVTEELESAARQHKEADVLSFFLHLDNTCQSCHQHFRPDLSWNL